VYAETEACAETSPRIASELRKRHSPSWPGIAWDPNLLALNQLVQGSTLLQRAIQTKVSAYSHNRKIALWCQIVGSLSSKKRNALVRWCAAMYLEAIGSGGSAGRLPPSS
jgi:hypothetical protein